MLFPETAEYVNCLLLQPMGQPSQISAQMEKISDFPFHLDSVSFFLFVQFLRDIMELTGGAAYT